MPKLFRIAYIVDSFPQLSETFLINQIVDLIDQGHDVHVLSSKKLAPPFHQKVIDYDLISKTYFLPSVPVSRILSFFLFFSFWIRHLNLTYKILHFFKNRINTTPWISIFYINKIKKINPDLIHAHFGNNGAMIADLKNAGLLEKKIPLLTTFHGYDLYPFFGNMNNYEYLIKIGDLYTANSGYTKKTALELGFPENKIQMLPVGLDTNLFTPHRPQNIIKERIKIIFVGRLIEFKAPDLIVLICNELKNRGISFEMTIIGFGKMYDQVNQMITENNLTNYIQLRGGLTQEQIILMMDESNVFLYPGIYDQHGRAENQGLVVQEAQSMKLPVIVSDAGGTCEGVLDGITGFVVKEKDIIGYANVIEHIVKHPDLCETMGKKAREFVQENFDSKILGKLLDEIYSQTIEQKTL